VKLQGVVSFSNPPPVVQWTAYAGPGAVRFGNAGRTNTTASFGAPGVYTLELGAADGVHAVAYDAVVITVTNALKVAIARSGTNVSFTWAGGTPPFVLEQAGTLPAGAWSGVVTTSLQNASVPVTNSQRFFRVRGQ
jgi:hypothetical protein